MNKSKSKCECIGRGRYRVAREFEIDGQVSVRSVVCTNPAYGFERLDELKERERVHAEDAKVREAMGEPKPRSKKGGL